MCGGVAEGAIAPLKYCTVQYCRDLLYKYELYSAALRNLIVERAYMSTSCIAPPCAISSWNAWNSAWNYAWNISIAANHIHRSHPRNLRPPT